MRILFLTKQQYMGKDLLRDRFGRFYELPKALAARGHDVRVVCLKYWGDEQELACRGEPAGVEWRSFALGRFWPAGFWRHLRRLREIAAAAEPDIVVGASDAAHVILAASISAQFGIPLAVDLYDDFESYRATRLPGVRAGLKRGIARAVAVSTVSYNLAAKVERGYRASGIVRTITNAVCPDIFHPREQSAARHQLGLPQRALLIGTAGSLSRRRGIDILIRAFNKIAGAVERDVYLILAGPSDRRFHLPRNDRIWYLGELPHGEIGCLFNALDVGVICNRRDSFVEYGFPQKLYEMIACGLPVVAANVGAVRPLLAGYEGCLYAPDEVESLAEALVRQLRAPQIARMAVPSWRTRGQEFHELLEEAVRRVGVLKHYERVKVCFSQDRLSPGSD